jgi:hypothetical protein
MCRLYEKVSDACPEEYSLLWRHVICYGINLRTFRRNALSPCSDWNHKPRKQNANSEDGSSTLIWNAWKQYRTTSCHTSGISLFIVSSIETWSLKFVFCRHESFGLSLRGRPGILRDGLPVGQSYSVFPFSRSSKCNFSSIFYPQSCWCIIQVIHSL